jgi:hypothetical protein
VQAVSKERSGEGGLDYLSHAVQLEVDFGARTLVEPRYLGLEFAHPASKAGHLEGEDLLSRRADVSHEGASHVATLHFP